jgi:hypothetical protein
MAKISFQSTLSNLVKTMAKELLPRFEGDQQKNKEQLDVFISGNAWVRLLIKLVYLIDILTNQFFSLMTSIQQTANPNNQQRYNET